MRIRRGWISGVRRSAVRHASAVPGGEQGAAEEAEGGWRGHGGVRHVLHHPSRYGVRQRIRRDQRRPRRDEPPGAQRDLLRHLRDRTVGAGAFHPSQAPREEHARG